MKILSRSLISLFLVIFSQISAQNLTWKALPNAPVAGRNDDLFFVDEKTGWVVNSSGQIWKTTDGGDNWTLQYQTSVYFRSVGFANSMVGWAGTLEEDSVLYKTTDGGNTWNLVTNILNPQPKRICGISVVDENTMFACGAFDGPARFIRTTDGGASWFSKDLAPQANTLIDIYFTGPMHGFVVGGMGKFFDNQTKPTILETFDGGENWVVKYLGREAYQWCWKINFLTPQLGFVSVENFDKASILKTTNGGVSWNSYDVSGNKDIQGIGFVSPAMGWVGGYGNTSITTDGGGSWTTIDFGHYLNRFRIINDTLAYASGSTIYKYSPEQVTSVNDFNKIVKADNYSLQNYPNPFNISTTIKYIIKEPANVKIRIFNSLGQDVATLVNEFQSAGEKTVVWNGRNSTGSIVSSGIYIYRLDAGNEAVSKTMILLK